jgi:predicted nucleic acid-binding protein
VMKRLFNELVITTGVWQEAVEEGKRKGKPDAYIIEKKIKDKVVLIHDSKDAYPQMALGKGEIETIHEAIDESVPAMIEDMKPRIIGSHLGLNVINLPLVFIRAFLEHTWTEREFDDALQKYQVQMSPSADHLVFIRNIKDLIQRNMGE